MNAPARNNEVQAEHFEYVGPHTVRHQPTGAVLAFPIDAPKQAGAPLCQVDGGTIGPDGANYALLDMIARARQFLISQAFAKKN